MIDSSRYQNSNQQKESLSPLGHRYFKINHHQICLKNCTGLIKQALAYNFCLPVVERPLGQSQIRYKLRNASFLDLTFTISSELEHTGTLMENYFSKENANFFFTPNHQTPFQTPNP